MPMVVGRSRKRRRVKRKTQGGKEVEEEEKG